MDVLYFLKERTRLIRQCYEHATHPFNEIIRKIEAEESQPRPNVRHGSDGRNHRFPLRLPSQWAT